MPILRSCVAVLALAVPGVIPLFAQNDDVQRKLILAELKKLNGNATVDQKSATKPIVGISLRGNRKAGDDTLALFKELRLLQSLDLFQVRITDGGLVHLKGLKELRNLTLVGAAVTDAGLENLKDLTKMKLLDLRQTKITDAGLVHLKGMSELSLLDVSETKVSAVGVSNLQRALPKVLIRR